MKSHDKIKEAMNEEHTIECLYPLVKPLIIKAYYMGYTDAVLMYQKCIDKKGLREAWDND